LNILKESVQSLREENTNLKALVIQQQSSLRNSTTKEQQISIENEAYLSDMIRLQQNLQVVINQRDQYSNQIAYHLGTSIDLNSKLLVSNFHKVNVLLTVRLT
jgi:hypothetical protein